MHLSTILEEYFMRNGKAFKENGDFTSGGSFAYDQLTSLLYDLSKLGIDFNVQGVIEELDEIIDIY